MDAFAPIDLTALTAGACDATTSPASCAFESVDIDALPRDEERIGAGTGTTFCVVA